MHDPFTCGHGQIEIKGDPCQYFTELKELTWGPHPYHGPTGMHVCCDTTYNTRQFITGEYKEDGKFYIYHSGPFGKTTSATIKCAAGVYTE